MSAKSTTSAAAACDWTCPELRSAMVDFAWSQIGEPPRSAEKDLAWMERLAAAARAAGLTGERGPGGFRLPGAKELLSWMRTRELQPADFRASLAPSHAGGLSAVLPRETVEGSDDLLSAAASDGRESAILLPSAETDPLTRLLQEEDGVLSSTERADLATALENGHTLTRKQRLALAVALRGSSYATRRDIFREMLDFLVSENEMTERSWKVVQTNRVLPKGASFLRCKIHPTISKFPRIGSRSLKIIQNGEVREFIPYADYQERPRGKKISVRRLVPVQRFAADLLARKLALFADLARDAERHGTDWARQFGETKANVSYHRKALVSQINKNTGGRAGFRGLRNKTDPRKGTKKSS